MFMVEGHELPDQPPVVSVGSRSDCEVGCAEEFGKFVEAQGDFANHTVTAASAALQGPEQVRIGAGIGKANLAVSRHDLGFEQAASGQPIMLREASEAAALNQAGHANRQASAALNVSPSVCGHGIV